MNATRILNEVKIIIKSIEIELNSLDTETKKIINNNVYSLGGNYYLTLKDTEKTGQKFYAFVIKKSFGLFNYGHKMTLELMSFNNTDNETNKNFKIDDYKLYKNKENLDIFDDESLVKIKYFLLSFATTE